MEDSSLPIPAITVVKENFTTLLCPKISQNLEEALYPFLSSLVKIFLPDATLNESSPSLISQKCFRALNGLQQEFQMSSNDPETGLRTWTQQWALPRPKTPKDFIFSETGQSLVNIFVPYCMDWSDDEGYYSRASSQNWNKELYKKIFEAIPRLKVPLGRGWYLQLDFDSDVSLIGKRKEPESSSSADPAGKKRKISEEQEEILFASPQEGSKEIQKKLTIEIKETVLGVATEYDLLQATPGRFINCDLKMIIYTPKQFLKVFPDQRRILPGVNYKGYVLTFIFWDRNHFALISNSTKKLLLEILGLEPCKTGFHICHINYDFIPQRFLRFFLNEPSVD